MADDTAPENEITATARSANHCREAAEATTPEPAHRNKMRFSTLGLGIGSAALAGAALYSMRSRRK
ncbi:hypothetical protein GCM10023219_10570 [Stakelama sediminis]|uniref:Uncharacterized protein n=1 Tax=Stakelama sediminis TaxID=463200 RepID=A0A840YVP9_9SPHN|nr:hypothetical protein [Stakelama sediminis]MBB5717781.1 hypothetical protein [Stakelama sediminis]